MRELRQPRFEPFADGLFEWMQICGELRVGFAQLGAELQQPRESVWTLETRSSVRPQIGSLLRDVLRRQTLFQRLASAWREWRVGKRSREPRE